MSKTVFTLEQFQKTLEAFKYTEPEPRIGHMTQKQWEHPEYRRFFKVSFDEIYVNGAKVWEREAPEKGGGQ